MLDEIVSLIDIIKQMGYILNQDIEKFIIFVNIPYLFLRDTNEQYLSLKDADNEHLILLLS